MIENLRFNNSEICFGALQKSNLNELLLTTYADAKKIIITDENVYELWIEDLITNFAPLSKAEIIQVPSGEAYKTIEVCSQIWSALSDYNIGRNDVIINFGGGVITDMGGFVASTFKRGLNFINIPTTLLSMVDASVGGKTGVDLGPFKNQIGLFSDASFVYIDERFLSTLEEEQMRSGYAEMLKHGLIADAEYWNQLKDFELFNTSNKLASIQRSVQLKKQIVELDREESGLRKILNFGHTIGHGIEGYFLENNTPVLHGFAVAWGMLAEAHIALKQGLISSEELEDIKQTVETNYPHLGLKEDDFKAVIKLMHNDKKNNLGVIQFSLLDGIGKGIFDCEVSDKLILDALKTISGFSPAT